MEVDYLKLSEQYAGFLIAVGGVSITVLALVLSLSSKKNTFLVAALVVATISCFTGAHMMAETAAFISISRGIPPLQPVGNPQSGERLFLLASTNIFIAVVLVIFALMLLPVVLLVKSKAAEIKLISISVFLYVIIAALSWMALSVYRMPAPHRWCPIIITAVGSIAWGFTLCSIIPEKCFLGFTFIPIIFFTLVSLLLFAFTFKNGSKISDCDIGLFSLAITSTCASLFVVALRQLEFIRCTKENIKVKGLKILQQPNKS